MMCGSICEVTRERAENCTGLCWGRHDVLKRYLESFVRVRSSRKGEYGRLEAKE